MANLVTWIDEKENELGEVSVTKAHQEGLLHRISVVYLINDKNEILIQRRDDGRLDHSAAGHVDAGEPYLEAAIRELKEELGVEIKDLELVGECSSKEGRGKIKHKFKVFLTKANPGKLNPEEVQEVFWAEPNKVWDDMKKDVDDQKYCRGFKATLELYLHSRK